MRANRAMLLVTVSLAAAVACSGGGASVVTDANALGGAYHLVQFNNVAIPGVINGSNGATTDVRGDTIFIAEPASWIEHAYGFRTVNGQTNAFADLDQGTYIRTSDGIRLTSTIGRYYYDAQVAPGRITINRYVDSVNARFDSTTVQVFKK